jgi:hypothetical protein
MKYTEKTPLRRNCALGRGLVQASSARGVKNKTRHTITRGVGWGMRSKSLNGSCADHIELPTWGTSGSYIQEVADADVAHIERSKTCRRGHGAEGVDAARDFGAWGRGWGQGMELAAVPHDLGMSSAAGQPSSRGCSEPTGSTRLPAANERNHTRALSPPGPAWPCAAPLAPPPYQRLTSLRTADCAAAALPPPLRASAPARTRCR